MVSQKRIKSTKPVFLFFIVLGVVVGVGFAQEATPQSIESIIQSIFPEDPCAPPCWFGITPGISTASDVEKMFKQHEALFDWRCYECTRQGDGFMTAGAVRFQWRTYTRDTPLIFSHEPDTQLSSDIGFDPNGIVDTIYLTANREITLGETLNALGKPDVATLSFVANYDAEFEKDVFGIFLIYIPQRLKMSLITYPYPTCNAASVLEDFQVDQLTYYSIDAATRFSRIESVSRNISGDYPQLVVPALVGWQMRGADWERFIQGEGYDQCEDFFDSLSETFIVPTLPWPSPTLTPVPTVAP